MNTQKDINTEGGDFAGRDLDKREYHFHNTESAILLQPYLELVKKMNAGFEIDIEEQIEDLEHYLGTEPYRVCRRPLFLRECPDEKSKIHP
ncbi:hypothetical protein [Acinetobacter sp. YH12025]|uniref:hypothetical protein n=1 Tax=Acinetobacter sp. YH12025 TaxID=2601042 RepID=UPI0015D1D0E3|nr:hypothetical protein [Acinetobacter sp. YH12025]